MSYFQPQDDLIGTSVFDILLGVSTLPKHGSTMGVLCPLKDRDTKIPPTTSGYHENLRDIGLLVVALLVYRVSFIDVLMCQAS